MTNSILKYNLDIADESRWLTVTASQHARSGLLYVQECGDFLNRAEYYTYREHLKSYQIILSISGKGLLRYRGENYEVPAGSLVYLDCMEPQLYRTDPETGNWHTMWVHFCGANAEFYHSLFDQQNEGSPIVNVGSDVALRSSIDLLLKLYASPGSTLQEDIQAASILTQLLTRAVLHTSGVDSGTKRVPGYVQDARSYIDLHYSERMTLDTLAEALSINKFYLQKLFKRSMGISPNEYLTYVRLNHAKQLLRSTNYSVSQIAMEIGMNNIGHFNEIFKRYENITPGIYRRQWYAGDTPELE